MSGPCSALPVRSASRSAINCTRAGSPVTGSSGVWAPRGSASVHTGREECCVSRGTQFLSARYQRRRDRTSPHFGCRSVRAAVGRIGDLAMAKRLVVRGDGRRRGLMDLWVPWLRTGNGVHRAGPRRAPHACRPYRRVVRRGPRRPHRRVARRRLGRRRVVQRIGIDPRERLGPPKPVNTRARILLRDAGHEAIGTVAPVAQETRGRGHCGSAIGRSRGTRTASRQVRGPRTSTSSRCAGRANRSSAQRNS